MFLWYWIHTGVRSLLRSIKALDLGFLKGRIVTCFFGVGQVTDLM